MTERENILAILRYQPYERMPVVSFGYWPETLRKWAEEGHISAGEAEGYARCGDNSEADFAIMRRPGFDFNWNACVGGNVGLLPPFPETVLHSGRTAERSSAMRRGCRCSSSPASSPFPPRSARR